MNKKINILSIILIIITIIVLATGSHVYDQREIVRGLTIYKINHAIHADYYKGLVKVNIMPSVDRDKQDNESVMREVNICYDGVYYVHLNTYYKYIKFYKDNTVITFSTNCPPENVLEWNEKQLEGSPKGEVVIKEDNIEFTTIQEKPEGYSVEVTYTGIQKNNALFLYSISNATSNESDLEYFYYEK